MNYVCDTSGKSFKLKSDLKRHVDRKKNVNLM